MTNERAKELMVIELKCDRNGVKCDIVQEANELNDAHVMAIQALNKQIPKKPDFEGDGYADGAMVYDTWICPTCSKYYEVDSDDYKYCPNCGQHIDWEVE